jgi:hypothetical protein
MPACLLHGGPETLDLKKARTLVGVQWVNRDISKASSRMTS